MRDNYHSAQVAFILQSAYGKKNARVDMADFFYEDSQTKRDRQDSNMLAWLTANSKRAEDN